MPGGTTRPLKARVARDAPVAAGTLIEPEGLILVAATQARQLTPGELAGVLAHVARDGFDPARNVPATGLSGDQWEGQILRGRQDFITSAARHYLRHVVRGQEWPDGTTLDRYEESIRRVVINPRSGAFTSRYDGQWQLGIVRRSGEYQGHGGFEWILVEYRIGIERWVTAFQPSEGLQFIRSPRRSDVRWLRRPR